MNLAKYGHGTAEAVGIVQRDRVLPLKLPGGGCETLFDVLESANPVERG